MSYDRRSYALFAEYTPTPTQTATPTPTIPPAEAEAESGVWSSPQRAAELNSIDWRSFSEITWWAGRIRNEGEMMHVPWRHLDGGSKYIDMDCAPRFGNRFDERNPTYSGNHTDVTIWVEPTDGGAPFCVDVDRFRDWLPTDQPPPTLSLREMKDFPEAVFGEPLVFTDMVNGPRYHTLPPSRIDRKGKELGRTFEVLEVELECVPHKLPLALWTDDYGFEVLGRDEEELLARYAFKGFKTVTDDPFYSVAWGNPEDYLESYDWESKGFWRNSGWFLAINNLNYPVFGFAYDARTFSGPGYVIYEFRPYSEANVRAGCCACQMWLIYLIRVTALSASGIGT